MKDGKFFTHPVHDWQRRYDALRASFVERLPARAVGERFNYSPTYVRLLRHLFMQGKIDFAEPVAEGKTRRRRVDAAIREKIRDWRWQKLSAGEITECLSEDGHEIFVHTVERVLREEGFPKLPRRTRLKMKITVKGGPRFPTKPRRSPSGRSTARRFAPPTQACFCLPLRGPVGV